MNDRGVTRYLDEKQLATRLGLSVKFLRRRRDLRLPPQYAKFGTLVRYPLASVEAFEAAALSTMLSDLTDIVANRDAP